MTKHETIPCDHCRRTFDRARLTRVMCVGKSHQLTPFGVRIVPIFHKREDPENEHLLCPTCTQEELDL